MAVDFEALDHVRAENKARVHEERKQMRIELAEYINKCDSYELSRLYDEYKRIRKNRLLTKKDFDSFFDGHNEYDFKKMSINKLRSTYGVTHLINGKYKDMRGNCFKCLTPLRADYRCHENYCMDCQ